MSQLSPSEKKGLFVLLGIILISFIFQWSQPYLVKTDLYDYSVQDSIFKSIATDTSRLEPIHHNDKKIIEVKSKKTPVKTNGLAQKSININTANKAGLEKLPRIGPATAKNIIEYREQNGPFKNIEDIKKVKRIGVKTLELIKPYIILIDKSK